MPEVTINGKNIEVERGTTVLQAAQRLGIKIPHYCYHPRLSIAGNCRMCLVELEKVPKLQTACSTVCQDGMVVRTDTERVRNAVKGVLEFILLNHPVDCPVCDQAGECGLQNYYMEYGLETSRFALEDKVHKEKAKHIGGLIMLDSERCILCTRCIRYLREILGTDEMNIFGRGARSRIDIYPGKPLANRYTGNLADICPVGALTEKEFRFQCRVWFMKAAKSICPGCARGCNMEIHYRGDRVYRLKPSLNDEVNGIWMCDIGRLIYTGANENRVEYPYWREEGGGRRGDWDAITYTVAQRIKGVIAAHGPESVGVIASPASSNEELYLTKRLAREGVGTQNLGITTDNNGDPYHDEFLVMEDKNPNTKGALELGIGPGEGGLDYKGILGAARKGEIKALIVVGSQLGGMDGAGLDEVLTKVGYVVNISPNESPLSERSSVVLASASFAEREGTYTNFEGRVQRFFRAVSPAEGAREDIWILEELAGKLGSPGGFKCSEEVFMEMAERVPFYRGLTYASIGYYGTLVGEKV